MLTLQYTVCFAATRMLCIRWIFSRARQFFIICQSEGKKTFGEKNCVQGCIRGRLYAEQVCSQRTEGRLVEIFQRIKYSTTKKRVGFFLNFKSNVCVFVGSCISLFVGWNFFIETFLGQFLQQVGFFSRKQRSSVALLFCCYRYQHVSRAHKLFKTQPTKEKDGFFHQLFFSSIFFLALSLSSFIPRTVVNGILWLRKKSIHTKN